MKTPYSHTYTVIVEFIESENREQDEIFHAGEIIMGDTWCLVITTDQYIFHYNLAVIRHIEQQPEWEGETVVQEN